MEGEMSADRIFITINLNGDGRKKLNTRRNVLVQSLIDEIRQRFDFPIGEYALVGKDAKEALDVGRTLAQYAIKDGDELLFRESFKQETSQTLALIQRGIREPIHGDSAAFLEEERQGQIFDIIWKPAVIGRMYQRDPSKNKLLAVDLSSIRGSDYVSRHHASITERAGQYFIEGLNERNPTYINDSRIEHQHAHILQPGDRIRVGKVVLIFNLRG